VKAITFLAFLLAVAACGEADVSEYQVINSSSLRILRAGQAPPAECTQVGTVAIEQRNLGFFARHFGLAEEEFHRTLDGQIAPLKANLLLPNEASDWLAAASSGQAFEGTAYSCLLMSVER
jgi:hypothetical protein